MGSESAELDFSLRLVALALDMLDTFEGFIFEFYPSEFDYFTRIEAGSFGIEEDCKSWFHDWALQGEFGLVGESLNPTEGDSIVGRIKFNSCGPATEGVSSGKDRARAAEGIEDGISGTVGALEEVEV